MKTTVPGQAVSPEPALAEAHYEAALECCETSETRWSGAPGTSAEMGEEEVRNLLLIGLNSHFEGQAAGEVFNNTGKTDILIRVLDTLRIKFGRDSPEAPNTANDRANQLALSAAWGGTGCPCENY
ncbi:hypothetical protein [Streptomyces osmaniensis]|uniref:Uncharacterized protein n=1 Tax=Streptomyces osmaniensis TaxID=593134 RepID=A0ABP6WNJ4_9ACTN